MMNRFIFAVFFIFSLRRQRTPAKESLKEMSWDAAYTELRRLPEEARNIFQFANCDAG